MRARAAAALLAVFAAQAWAQAPHTLHSLPDGRSSQLPQMSPALQAMQRDDTLNPAALWLADGRARFEAQCARCHTPEALRGAAARHPAYHAASGRVLSLSQRVEQCRRRDPAAQARLPDDDERLALETYVASLSRGQPIAPDPHPRVAAAAAAGQALYRRRMGQLDLSCAMCHDGAAGARLAGSLIPQGHPTGYPIYRLEWQGMGTLQRRLRGCLTGVRAQPWDWDADELVALEAHLMRRAAGLAVETPAVRP